MNLIDCDLGHADAIRAIFNEAILTSTALYDHEPRSKETVDQWVAGKRDSNLPLIGLQTDEGVLAGFASYGSFRPWSGYRFTVEHTLYIHKDYRGRGLGRRLLTRLIELAAENGYHAMVGGIDSENRASIRLHEQLGFWQCAHIREAGFKFDRWLDLVFYQRLLTKPPVIADLTHP